MKNSAFGPFKLYEKKPNAISYGSLYTCKLKIPGVPESLRTARVWLPEGYDPLNKKKRYPVIYMCDGQNLVDRYTSAYGEWNIDVRVHELMKDGFPGLIVVGTDCPVVVDNRTSEYCPPIKPDRKVPAPADHTTNHPYGEKYASYVMNKLKPLVDRNFNTDPSKKATGVGGSSMGGIMAFYLGCEYHDKVGFSLCFSPAFLLYSYAKLKEGLAKWNPDPKDYGKFFFYTGGTDFEANFVKSTFLVHNALKEKGFPNEQIELLYDANEIHHEKAWSIYFPLAISYLLPYTPKHIEKELRE